MAVTPTLTDFCIALSGLKHATLAHIYDARSVALVSLLSDHLRAKSFLHLRPIHELRSTNVALAIAVRMLLAYASSV